MRPDKSLGVLRKILDQIEAWYNCEQEVFPILIAENNTGFNFRLTQKHAFIKVKSKWDKFLYLKKVYRLLKAFNPDIVYSRNINLVPYLFKIAWKYNYVIEVNSFLMIESKIALKRSKTFLFDYIWRKLTRILIYNIAAGFVSVSHEIIKKDLNKFNKPSIVIPNAINCDKVPLVKSFTRNDKSKINLFFIGTPDQDWHGIDKIIEFAKKTIDKTEIHLVGISNPPYEIPANLKCHGYCSFDEYKDIIKNCHIAIGTLALHRKKMEEASSLKVREYLALGFPTIIAYNDTAFINTDFPFLLKLPNNENNINDNYSEIIHFIKKNKNRVVSRADIIDFIDINRMESLKLDFFKNELNGLR